MKRKFGWGEASICRIFTDDKANADNLPQVSKPTGHKTSIRLVFSLVLSLVQQTVWCFALHNVSLTTEVMNPRVVNYIALMRSKIMWAKFDECLVGGQVMAVALLLSSLYHLHLILPNPTSPERLGQSYHFRATTAFCSVSPDMEGKRR